MKIKLLSILAILFIAISVLSISCDDFDSCEEWDDIEYSTHSGRRATRAAEPNPEQPASVSGLIKSGSTNGKSKFESDWGTISCSAKFSWPTTTTDNCDETDIDCTDATAGCATPLCKIENINCSAGWDIQAASITYTFTFKILTGTINPMTGAVSWTDQGNYSCHSSTSIRSYIEPY